jgi:hypothetical protein
VPVVLQVFLHFLGRSFIEPFSQIIILYIALQRIIFQLSVIFSITFIIPCPNCLQGIQIVTALLALVSNTGPNNRRYSEQPRQDQKKRR